MHDVVCNGATDADHANACGAGFANMFVRLMLSLRRVMLLPGRVVILSDVRHGETIENSGSISPAPGDHMKTILLDMLEAGRVVPLEIAAQNGDMLLRIALLARRLAPGKTASITFGILPNKLL